MIGKIMYCIGWFITVFLVAACVTLIFHYVTKDMRWKRRLRLEEQWLNAYQEGIKAFERGDPESANPYTKEDLKEGGSHGYIDADMEGAGDYG